MIVVFIVDNDFDKIHFCKQADFEALLDRLGISKDRVKLWTVSMATLIRLWDGAIKHIVK